MSKEKQILKLLSDGDSQRRIANILSVSRNTVASVLTAAKRSGLNFQELLQLDEKALFQTLFPEKAALPILVPPDYEKIHKELLRDGVTLILLWEEYVDECREAQKPPYILMLNISQFLTVNTGVSPDVAPIIPPIIDHGFLEESCFWFPAAFSSLYTVPLGDSSVRVSFDLSLFPMNPE